MVDTSPEGREASISDKISNAGNEDALVNELISQFGSSSLIDDGKHPTPHTSPKTKSPKPSKSNKPPKTPTRRKHVYKDEVECLCLYKHNNDEEYIPSSTLHLPSSSINSTPPIEKKGGIASRTRSQTGHTHLPPSPFTDSSPICHVCQEPTQDSLICGHRVCAHCHERIRKSIDCLNVCPICKFRL